MSVVRLSYPHSLALAVLRKRVVDLGKTLELVSHACISWRDDDTLDIRGANVQGHISIEAQHLTLMIRLGPALRPIIGSLRQVFERELQLTVALDRTTSGPDAAITPVTNGEATGKHADDRRRGL